MNLKLPEPTIVEGRVLYTTAQMKQYGATCYDAGVGSVIVTKDVKPSNAGLDELFKIFKGSK